MSYIEKNKQYHL